MKRLLLALLALMLVSPVFAGMNRVDLDTLDFDAIRDRIRNSDRGLAPQGFYMNVSLVDVTSQGSPTFQINWGGPGLYSVYGGCPSGDCDGQYTIFIPSPVVVTQYGETSYALPPGFYGIFTHTGVPPFPTSTYTTPGGSTTTYSSTVATSQPNNLHAFILLRYEPYGGTYPVFFSTSIPGQSILGPGRNYVATVQIPALPAGEYTGSAIHRLLHYRTYTTTTTYTTSPFPTTDTYTVPCGWCVGGTETPENAYLIDYAELDVNARIPTTDNYGLLALALVLAGAGLLVLSRRRVAV